MTTSSRRLIRHFSGLAAPYLVFVVAVLVSGIFVPAYAEGGFIWTLLVLASFTILASCGQTVVVLTGGLDLSIASAITASAVVLTWSYGATGSDVLSLAAALATGLVIGLFNGLVVALLRFSPIVVTLATNVIVAGLLLVFTGGSPAGQAPPSSVWLMTARVAGIPVIVLALALFVAAAIFVLHFTTLGRRLYGVGVSQRAMYFAGARVWAVKTVAYSLSGLCAALAGIALSGYSERSYLSMGEPYLLLTLTAVVVGGVSILGGRGYFSNVVAAALILVLVETILNGSGMSSGVRQLLYGLAIVVAVVGTHLRERFQRVSRKRKESEPETLRAITVP